MNIQQEFKMDQTQNRDSAAEQDEVIITAERSLPTTLDQYYFNGKKENNKLSYFSIRRQQGSTDMSTSQSLHPSLSAIELSNRRSTFNPKNAPPSLLTPATNIYHQLPYLNIQGHQVGTAASTDGRMRGVKEIQGYYSKELLNYTSMDDKPPDPPINSKVYSTGSKHSKAYIPNIRQPILMKQHS